MVSSGEVMVLLSQVSLLLVTASVHIMVTPCGLGSRFFDRARVHFMVSSGEVMVLLLRGSRFL